MKATCLGLAIAPFLIAGCVPGVGSVGGSTDIGGGGFGRSGPPPAFEPTTSALSPPPAITGGTLRALHDGRTAVAADPDRDSIFVADYASGRLVATVKLQPGDEPGRVIEDDVGRVHVALRRGGAVVTLNPGTWDVAARRQVCAAPRGLDYDPGSQLVYVACAEGQLVSLPAAPDGAVTQRIALDRDLRDVVAKGGGRVLVSRFRSSEVLVVQDGTVVSRMTPPSSSSLGKGVFVQPAGGTGVVQPPSMVPAVGWRMIDDPHSTGVVMLHQRALDGPVSVQQGGYGGALCGGIVETAVTPMRPDVAPAPATGALANVTLGVDVAMSRDGSTFAAAVPGNARQQGNGLSQIAVFDGPSYFNGTTGGGGCSFPSGQLPPVNMQSPAGTSTAGTQDPNQRPGVLASEPLGEVVAVAFDDNNQLLVQTREPATVQVPTSRTGQLILLAPDSRMDTGHSIFHANTGAGVACASCHPEGGDDGRVWTFMGKDGKPEPRRTQNLRGGVLATAPFHWDGSLQNMDSLMTEVFVGRMSGPPLAEDQVGSLSHWLDGDKLLPALPVADQMAADRGRVLFSSAGCTTCHMGTLLTDNKTQNVGTGLSVQTPSLRGVGWRAPFMHDGCAKTLADRFTSPCGGGDKHGTTSRLTPDQISDLTAFVETL
jgi:mono/diheme cytochrome c family protein